MKQRVTSSRTGQRAVASHRSKHLITKEFNAEAVNPPGTGLISSLFINYLLNSGSSAPVRSILSRVAALMFHVA